jgi:hypothetical protein
VKYQLPLVNWEQGIPGQCFSMVSVHPLPHLAAVDSGSHPRKYYFGGSHNLEFLTSFSEWQRLVLQVQSE